ncbi:hypothetical protein JB92DRAFT_2882581 [Gautieria morchelliformis]|nr:hypothetical protein JB92DRAFT_2882581 [Gautieria morchelliformis]
MAKKKNKIVVRPWCWYCEREFEDEKVLMQHQKAKHFKCNQCPRRLNTAGGLAVHIQQVHKLDPDQLPRIENALPGRDGYEVEIFGMEGIPAPDVADYKRRKEQELGLPAGSISGSGKGLPQNKRPRIENRVLSEDELRAQLQAHKALMGGGDAAPAPAPAHGGAVYNAAPQTYATPSAPPSVPPFPPGMMPPPGAGPFPGGPPPGFPGGPPPGFPGQPPFPPFPQGAGFPPGPPPPGFPFPPPGLLRPGQSPLPPGAPVPPFPPGGLTPGASGTPATQTSTPPQPSVPTSGAPAEVGNSTSQTQAPAATVSSPRPRTPLPPNPPQSNPALKAGTVLVWQEPNYSPVEKRAQHPKYRYVPQPDDEPMAAKADGPRGTKRARAEDFL